jgi:hypothetical protein
MAAVAPATPGREIEIIATVDIPSTDPKRTGKIDVLVTYRIGAFQSGMVMVPKEEANEARIKAAIKADVEAKAKFVGMKFTV